MLSAQSKLRSLANIAAVFVLAAFASLNLMAINAVWDPGYYGDLGLRIDNISFLVDQVDAGSPADKAGVKLGDQVDRAIPFREHFMLTHASIGAAETFVIHFNRQGQTRAVTLQARQLPPLSPVNRIALVLQIFVFSIFVGVSAVLVLLRPSTLTWSFYIFAVAVIIGSSDPFLISYIPTGWLIALILAADVIVPAGCIGFIVFCLRFPTNTPTGWRRVLDQFIPYLFAGTLILYACNDFTTTFVYHSAENIARWEHIWFATLIAECVLASAALLTSYFDAAQLERHKIKWVVVGFTCAALALVLSVFFWEGVFPTASIWYSALPLLYLVLPLTVAYAVIRHRVIDVRFVASRSLALGVIGLVLTLMFIGIDWLFSRKLPNSHFEAAAYAGVALLVGFSLNAARQRIGSAMDFLFFHRWYRTQEQAEIIAVALRRATSKADLYKPLTAGIAGAFSLASAALFERVEGGGFVRVAAHGWLAGTIWHLLPGDTLVERAASARVLDIDTLPWDESDLPAGLARPSVLLPVIARKQVAAVLLCGAHEDGSSLAPDEIRTVRALCADAGLVYATSLAPESWRTDFRGAPLSA